MVKILGSKKFEKIASANSEDDSIFIDSSDDKLKFKDTDSAVNSIAYEAITNNLYAVSGLNIIRQLIDRSIDFSAGEFDWFADAYIDSNGRENSVDLDKDMTGAEFASDKYKVPDVYSLVSYVIIEATSMGSWTNGTNDTYVNKIDVGKWLVWCDTGTDEVQRAQIHKSLWFGSTYTLSDELNAINPLIEEFTGVTSVQSTDSRDIGKRALLTYRRLHNNDETGGNRNSTGTFSDTSTNTDCCYWSDLFVIERSGNATSTFEVPDGTVLHTTTGGGTGGTWSSEMGTDKSADELDNPATTDFYIYADDNSFSGSTGGDSFCLFLLKGTISWVETTDGTQGDSETANRDYYADDSIPLMTLAGALLDEISYFPITHDIPAGTFSSAISSAIGVPLVADWETGADIKYKVINTFSTDISTHPYIEITAGGLSTSIGTSDIKVGKLNDNSWIVYVLTGTDEERRAKLYDFLFYGENILEFENITALKTNVTRDVGKRGHVAKIGIEHATGTYTGTFADTSTNTGCSSWSTVNAAVGAAVSSWEMPSATVLNTATDSATSNEFNIDTTADELDNPATCQLDGTDPVDSGAGYIRALILCSGDISWVEGGTPSSASVIDFYTDYNIPDLTLASNTFTDDDSGWLECGVSPEINTFTAFAVPPNSLIIKLIPKTTSPTAGYPSIRGFAIKCL